MPDIIQSRLRRLISSISPKTAPPFRELSLWRGGVAIILFLLFNLVVSQPLQGVTPEEVAVEDSIPLVTKPYFHSQPYACDGDCEGTYCWADADGNPVSRRMLLKTNIPAWACLWQNLAAEIDIIPHFSFELPVYWSPYNYGSRNLKFRVFSIIPKFRYWFSPDNDGAFFDVHAGFAYYNIALNGDHRYQDHNGSRPAGGGGVGFGYRFRLPNPRWKIETVIGFGVYSLDYDIFSYSHKGLVVDRKKRTFLGVDNFAVSLSYEFYLRPKRVKGGGE